jgi:predicted aspartyl protease
VTTYQAPVRNPRDLKLHGPRLKITIGPPLLNLEGRNRTTSVSDAVRFTETDALIDTGAQRTVVSPEAVRRAGLSKINEADIRGVGGIVKADVYVASLQFPRCGLRTIEVIEVSCCGLSHILYHCLLGRDVLSRWILTYDGPAGAWQISEGSVSSWVEPPEGSDPDRDPGLWGK